MCNKYFLEKKKNLYNYTGILSIIIVAVVNMEDKITFRSTKTYTDILTNAIQTFQFNNFKQFNNFLVNKEITFMHVNLARISSKLIADLIRVMHIFGGLI